MVGKARELYAYSPLLAHPNSIRLLRLLPASRAEDPIHCRIFNYSLTTPERTSHLYECLSYVWGSVEEKQTIRVNGAELAVTRNLCGALRRLRDPDLDRILWVDAVCINQDDLEERANQVQIMALIYAYASRVVVWLGEEADGSKEAMELFRADASRVYRKQRELQATQGDQPDQASGESNVSGDLLPDETTNSLQSKAMTLLKRPWFRRIWVLQEIAAARVMVVLCGSDELTGACFFWGLSGLLEWCQDAELRGTVSSILYLLGDASVLRVNKPTDLEPFRLGICSLSQLVDMFRLREATDPRDKVYALLGIMSQDILKIEIVPDYGVHWDDLFRKLVRSILGLKVEAAWISHDREGHGQVSAKGCTVGYISSVNVSKSDRQVVSITRTYRCSPSGFRNSIGNTEIWVLHNSAAAVEQGDIVCWLEGSRGATIIRFQGDCFTIVVAWARFSTAFEKDLFRRGQLSSHHLSHEQWMHEALELTQYNRKFVLLWPFHNEWKTQTTEAWASEKQSPELVSSLACIVPILEDVDSTEALQSLFEQGSHQLRSEENAPAGVVDLFRDMGKTLPNWGLYLDLKDHLRSVLSLELESALPNEIELDLVEVRRRLHAGPELGTDIIKTWFDGLSFAHEPDFGQLRRLAFLLDVWGQSITVAKMIEMVELLEKTTPHRATMEMFSSRLHTRVIEVLVQLTSQHPDWGNTLVEELIRRAKGYVDRVYCLVRALIICGTASSEWKQTVVQAVLETHSEEPFRAKVETFWISPRIEQSYEAAVDFLWRQYILEAKDYVGISPSGTFQLRSELMQEFVNEYRFWKACYDGNLADVWSGAAEGRRARPLLITCKDKMGSWCRVSATEAAVMNGHVECCKLLLALLDGADQQNHGCTAHSVIQVYLSRGGNSPMASEISELLGTNQEHFEGSKLLPAEQGQRINGVISRDGRRSETW
ncbi:HET-domain-containing protein [Paraphaeosphaeria sporulosa]|uniref:HET-domain-containing protein n=1 Tax=Paraphaeosphaeria sporulosa TaxID=1460663 RepID=A0A177CFS2_9PLEO|nr:HET-domain-containing protein [Paraphaeosphaeria sporulosa]OAG06464.1 HET-domain-containing protein [Paraphaeosphaeria sporulosa]